LNSGTQARAEWRALISAACIGSGVGLALGGLYLGAGMGQAAIDHSRAEQVAQVGQSLRGPLSADAVARALAAQAAPGAQVAQVADVKQARARELDCLAQAVYFEARGESPRGQAAVATVIMNRVKNPHFPKTVCGVVYQGVGHHNGCQFSFACDGHAERVVEWGAWDQARKVAGRVLAGAVLRDVGSATHFHTTDVDPDWGGRMLRVAQVGLHVFYRFNPHAPPPSVDDEDDPPQFASRAAPATPLRLAAAVVAPSAAVDAAKPAAAVEAKSASKSADAASPIARTDAPAPAKSETATTS
jgi:spore germination cell wall hydrolase CwlJ-like protein